MFQTDEELLDTIEGCGQRTALEVTIEIASSLLAHGVPHSGESKAQSNLDAIRDRLASAKDHIPDMERAVTDFSSTLRRMEADERYQGPLRLLGRGSIFVEILSILRSNEKHPAKSASAVAKRAIEFLQVGSPGHQHLRVALNRVLRGEPRDLVPAVELARSESALGIRFYIDPADASVEEIQAVLLALSDLQAAAGGLGLKFSGQGQRAVALEGAGL